MPAAGNDPIMSWWECLMIAAAPSFVVGVAWPAYVYVRPLVRVPSVRLRGRRRLA